MQPHTPTKSIAIQSFTRSGNSFTRDSEVDRSFLDFSDEYKLQLSIPDVAALEQSPQRRRQLAEEGLEDQEVTIYHRYRIHFRRGVLNSFREHYHSQAQTLCQQWISKPRGEWNVTPRIATRPEATNSAERDELRQLLYQVLAKHQPPASENSSYTSKVLRNGREIPAFSAPYSKNSGRTPRPPAIKRGSDDFSDVGPKRPKNITAGSSVANPSFGSSEPGGKYDHSFHRLSTNVSYGSTVFSDHDHSVSQGTQDTVEASSQEKLRWPPQQPRSAQHELFVSSGSLRGVNESLNNIGGRKEMHDTPQRNLDSSSPTRKCSNSDDLLSDHELYGIEPNRITSRALQDLQDRLDSSWPPTPPGLVDAPFPVVWEVLRVLLHCRIDSRYFGLEYDENWNDQNQLWRILQSDTTLIGKVLPEKSSAAAWGAALSGFRVHKQAVTLVAHLTPSTGSTGSFFQVQLQPLKIDATHRLARRFGSDRFMEVIIPSIDPHNISIVKGYSDEAVRFIQCWISRSIHPVSGRCWKSFFVRSIRETPSRRPTRKSDRVEPEPKQIMKDKFYFFAQDGDDFQTPTTKYSYKIESTVGHMKMSTTQLVEWLLQPAENDDQPSLKLFSRIALGLSRTEPTVTLEKDQFRHKNEDICSPTGAVMNDGIGRMSPALARLVRDSMGLTDTPAGFQGRVGSAKGFWILDVSERFDEIWIETYPSQRKWNCDFDDEDHRTFEVSGYPILPNSASLNTQFLPILMEQAPSKRKRDALKAHLRSLLIRLLNDEIEAQRIAMQDPLSCSIWVDQRSSRRRFERLQDDEVPRLGSVPRHDEDRIQFLLSGGFDPLKQKYLWEMIWKLCKERCEELKKRINIKVGQSIYAYMVIDFEGILAEDEVHVSFSSNFKDELSGFSDTHLHGVDVLVARSPAHFVSDIQKVKAVFRPELGALKDVIVFPSNGNVPLADKLSGGDYDGDMAWVCWDADIVKNFESAKVPVGPDLVQEGFISKRTGNYRDLVEKHKDRATLRFLEEGLEFNLQPTYLGMCTAFKENVCYHRKCVSDAVSVRLSTMLSNLVDQVKQGVVFTSTGFSRFKKSILKNAPEPAQPKYKADAWSGKGSPSHIIDYLKFSVIIPTVDAELDRLSKATEGHKAELWDEDLVLYWNRYNDLRVKKNQRVETGMITLLNDLQHFHREVEILRAKDDLTFDAKVWRIYDLFQVIQPEGFKGTLREIITLSHRQGQQHSEWSLLKASTYYKNYYNRSTFIWWIIGSELQEIKTKASRGGPTVTLNAMMYAAMRPDPKYVRARDARREGIGETIQEALEPWEE